MCHVYLRLPVGRGVSTTQETLFKSSGQKRRNLQTLESVIWDHVVHYSYETSVTYIWAWQIVGVCDKKNEENLKIERIRQVTGTEEDLLSWF